MFMIHIYDINFITYEDVRSIFREHRSIMIRPLYAILHIVRITLHWCYICLMNSLHETIEYGDSCTMNAYVELSTLNADSLSLSEFSPIQHIICVQDHSRIPISRWWSVINVENEWLSTRIQLCPTFSFPTWEYESVSSRGWIFEFLNSIGAWITCWNQCLLYTNDLQHLHNLRSVVVWIVVASLW